MPLTVGEIFDRGRRILEKEGVPEPYADAQVLLADVLGIERIGLYRGNDSEVEERDGERYMDRISLRGRRVPLCYLTGRKEFMGIEFLAREGVLIPRPETELLVEKALELISGRDYRDVLDIGTGCGNIAVSLAAGNPGIRVTAVDADERAVELASENAGRAGVQDRVTFLKGDMFAPLGDGDKFDLVVSNPPYIRSGDMESLQPEVRQEPAAALDGGEDGLFFYRRIAAECQPHLGENGMLALETGYDQMEDVCGVLSAHGYIVKYRGKDLSGLDRVVAAECHG